MLLPKLWPKLVNRATLVRSHETSFGERSRCGVTSLGVGVWEYPLIFLPPPKDDPHMGSLTLHPPTMKPSSARFACPILDVLRVIQIGSVCFQVVFQCVCVLPLTATRGLSVTSTSRASQYRARLTACMSAGSARIIPEIPSFLTSPIQQ